MFLIYLTIIWMQSSVEMKVMITIWFNSSKSYDNSKHSNLHHKIENRHSIIHTFIINAIGIIRVMS